MTNQPTTPQWIKSLVVPVRGKFIVIEGIDGSGKTTLAERLARLLNERDQKTFCTSFPSKTLPIGRLVRSMFNGETEEHCMQLLMLAEMFDEAKAIRRRLDEGTTMIADRWCYSTTAYSHRNGVDPKWVEHVRAPLLQPDLILLLDVDLEVAIDRIDARGEGKSRYEDARTLKGAHKYYREVLPKLHPNIVHVIDGTKTRHEIEEIAMGLVTT